MDTVNAMAIISPKQDGGQSKSHMGRIARPAVNIISCARVAEESARIRTHHTHTCD